MPPIFKPLASISAWILFIVGFGFILSSFMGWAAVGFGRQDWQMGAVYDALGVASIILSVVANEAEKEFGISLLGDSSLPHGIDNHTRRTIIRSPSVIYFQSAALRIDSDKANEYDTSPHS